MATQTCRRCGLPSPPREAFETCWACEALEDPAASARLWRAGLEDLAARGIALADWLTARDRTGYPVGGRRHRQELSRLAMARGSWPG